MILKSEELNDTLYGKMENIIFQLECEWNNEPEGNILNYYDSMKTFYNDRKIGCQFFFRKEIQDLTVIHLTKDEKM